MWACLVHLCTMPPKYLNSATYSRTAPLYDSMVAQARVRGSSISVVLGPHTRTFPTLWSLISVVLGPRPGLPHPPVTHQRGAGTPHPGLLSLPALPALHWGARMCTPKERCVLEGVSRGRCRRVWTGLWLGWGGAAGFYLQALGVMWR